MKKITFFAMAAMVAMGLSGCQKGEPGNGGNGATTDSRMGLTLELPANFFAPESRADQDATFSDETNVNTVHVWVFNADGTPAAPGGYTLLNRADFTPVANALGANVYTLAEDKYFEVKASAKPRIYVGVNVPSDVLVALSATEASLLAAIDNVADMAGADNFTMFSELVNNVVLKSYITGDPSTVTEVPVSVGRVVSKVVATTETATIEPTLVGTETKAVFNTTAGVELIYDVVEYNVYNEALDSYLVEQATTKSTLNDFDASYAKVNKTIGVLAADEFDTDAERNATLTGLANRFYIGENKSTAADPNGISRVGKTTYAFVATKVRVNKLAEWDATLNENAGGMKWVAVGAEGETTVGNEDLFIVTLKDDKGTPIPGTYICDTEGLATIEDTGIECSYYTYTQSYVHFLVWLNHISTNKADIGRNQFIHLHVTGVTGAEGSFPGYPGDPTDPKKPIDPTDEDNNPDPKIPTDPIDPTPSKLKVVVTVKPWTYMYNGAVLSK